MKTARSQGREKGARIFRELRTSSHSLRCGGKIFVPHSVPMRTEPKYSQQMIVRQWKLWW